MVTDSEKINKLVSLIDEELALCDIDTTPVICETIKTDEGKGSVRNMLMERVMNGMSISEAINDVEKSFNPNRAED